MDTDEQIEDLLFARLITIMVDVLNFDQNMFFKSYWAVHLPIAEVNER